MVTRDTAWPSGTPCWVDLGVDDIARAVTFYSQLFGWDIQPGPPEAGGYHMCLKDGRQVAGIGPQQAPPGTSPFWTVYIASADLMPRNLDHRVELAVPIEAPELRAYLLDTLERAFADNQNSWELDSEGVWTKRSPKPGERPRSLQLELAELHAGRIVGEESPASAGTSGAGHAPAAALGH